MPEQFNDIILNRILAGLDGKRAPEYRALKGTYAFDTFVLTVDDVPDDPSRAPVRLRAEVALTAAKFPHDVFVPKSREVAARDFICRRFDSFCGDRQSAPRGIKGGKISVERPVRQLLEISAVVVDDRVIEVRFTAELPLQQGKIPGAAAVELFMKRIPEAVRGSLFFAEIDGEALADTIETNEDADTLRTMLSGLGLAAFIADGSLLVRHGGPGERAAVPFTAPDALAVTVELPNRGLVRGMGIPAGITLIAGAWGQGKSTILRAIELGVYNHVFGDGRELVVTVPDAVGIRAEEGRRIEGVDVSPVISVSGADTNVSRYSTTVASSVFSVAANIMEALEIGTSLLLFDEDATLAAMLGHDARLQALIPPGTDPLTPLADLLPMLSSQHGVSSIIVGGTGDYLDIADTVIVMDRFVPAAVATAQVERIVRDYGCARTPEHTRPFAMPKPRRPYPGCLLPPKNERPARTPAARFHVRYGDESIDMSAVSQVVSVSQRRTIARGIALVSKLIEGSSSLPEAVHRAIQRMETVGLDTLSNRRMGDLAGIRAHELAAALNRLSTLRII